MLRRSGPISLLVHAFRAFCAMLLTWPLSADLQGHTLRHLYRPRLGADDAALLLEVAARRAPLLMVWAPICALVYLLATPLLNVLWLHAMRRTRGTVHLLRATLRDYPAALALGIGAAVVTPLMLAPAALLLYAGPPLATYSERAQDLLRALALATAFAPWIFTVTLHDRARAALVLGSRRPRTALRRGLGALRASDLACRALLSVGLALLVVAAEAASRVSSGVVPPWAVAALQQLILMFGTLAQALWWARLLRRERARDQPAILMPRVSRNVK